MIAASVYREKILIKLVNDGRVGPGMNTIPHSRGMWAYMLPHNLHDGDFCRLIWRVLIADHPEGNVIRGRIHTFGPQLEVAVLWRVSAPVLLPLPDDAGRTESMLPNRAADRSGKDPR